MNFIYSKQGLSGGEKRLQRLLEILPGAASWTTLLGMGILSFWKPILVAVLVIAYDLYWLLRLLYMTLFLVAAYLRLSRERQTDWMAKVRGLGPHEIHHLVILPVARESKKIIEPGIQALAEQTFPSQKTLVVLAVEERASPEIKNGALEIQQAFRDRFLDCLVVVHPDGLPGEARVKGANASYAAKEAARYFELRKISFENVIASCFDADTVVGPQYFACLTYHFLACPDRTRASFQPIPVYHNNIWDVPGFARVLDIGASFMQMVEATNPEKLITFSSHSMSFKALVEVGFWPLDMISDDSAIFWKSFIHFDGRYRVVPMYITLSMDIAAAETWWKTAINVYKQKRRWAWGAENFPIVIRAFLKAREIPLTSRIRHGFKLFESHWTWATGAFLLAVIGWLPVFFAGREFSNTVLYYSAPRIKSIIFHLASLSLVTTIFLSLTLLPKRRLKHSFLKKLGHAVEWLSVPVVFTFLSAVPALDAQTRLMLGRHMEFWVTEKKRDKAA